MNAAAEPIDSTCAGVGPECTDNAPVRLPPVKVRIEPEDVAAFCHATGGHRVPVEVPLTFPARWLALPDARDLIVRSIGSGFIPVHEAQNFAYEHALQIETDYVLAIEARRSPAPPRLTLQMAITSPAGEICARLETILRIVPAMKPVG
jgi:hypothetical protein